MIYDIFFSVSKLPGADRDLQGGGRGDDREGSDRRQDSPSFPHDLRGAPRQTEGLLQGQGAHRVGVRATARLPQIRQVPRSR